MHHSTTNIYQDFNRKYQFAEDNAYDFQNKDLTESQVTTTVLPGKGDSDVMLC